MNLITINQAAEISNKSVQTIRRMIKQKKIHVKKQRTPQGFNYLIIEDSFNKFMEAAKAVEVATDPDIQEIEREHRPISQNFEEDFRGQLDNMNSTIQKLIDQNERDRQKLMELGERDKENFFGLIKTFQDRVVVLENHIKLLESPKKNSWWKLW